MTDTAHPIEDIPPKRLLVLHQGALGDFIAIFPILAGLRRLYAGVDALCRSAFGPLAKHLGLIDAGHAVESARFASLYTNTPDPRMTTWLASYDAILLFSFSDELARGLRGASGRRVYRIPPWPKEDPCLQVTRYLVHHLLGTGLLSAEEEKRFEGALAALLRKGPDGSPSNRLLLGPGAGGPSKRWPLASFLRLAEGLSQMGFRPQFVLGPLEADIAAQLTDHYHSPFPIVKPENLNELADRLKRAAGYIGNDSSVGHLAAFLKRPTVIVFGPSNPECWAPFGPAVGIVKSEMECRPCHSKKSAACPHRNCLQSISPQRVRDVFAELHKNYCPP